MAEKAFNIDENNYRELDKLAITLEPLGDKGSNWHNYTKIYSLYFAPIKNEPLRLLEIGIYKGASVILWENYFPNAELHFIDITLANSKYSSKRSHYHLADQSNSQQLLNVVSNINGKFDIIIDDGGHTMQQQIVSFTTLFPSLKSGGMYIIEDLHTSYWSNYGGDGSIQNPKAGPSTAIQFFKNLIDDVNFVGARTQKANHDLDLSSIQNELSLYRKEILGIHFYDSLCIVIKK